MEKQKPWQLSVILIVCLLTLYNILPTVIFYSKPLNQPVDKPFAKEIATGIQERVNSLEPQSLDWLDSFTKLLGTEPRSMKVEPSDPSVVSIQFKDAKDAKTFARFLPRAGSLISFVPMQMALLEGPTETNSVKVLRNMGMRLTEKDANDFFTFAEKEDSNGNITDFYYTLLRDRFSLVATTLAGPSGQQALLREALQDSDNQDRYTLDVAKQIVLTTETFGEKNPLTQRFYNTFSQTELPNQSALIDRYQTKLSDLQKKFDSRLKALSEEKKAKEEKGELIDLAKLEEAEALSYNTTLLETAESIISANKKAFTADSRPITKKQVNYWLDEKRKENPKKSAVFTLPIGKKNPLVKALELDLASETITLKLHDDVEGLIELPDTSELIVMQKDEINRLVMNELARVSQLTDEKVVQAPGTYRIDLYNVANAKSLLALDLEKVAKKTAASVLAELKNEWQPTHKDLVRDALPIFTLEEFQKATPEQKRLSILVVAPKAGEKSLGGLRQGSVYVVLRGVQNIIDQYNRFPESPEAKLFTKEISEITKSLQKRGFIGYEGARFSQDADLAKDFVFELDDYYSMLIAATRENFTVAGSKAYASLEFSDVEQRILTENQIDNAIQEDLLRWKETYQAAQVSLDALDRYTVPKPTKNVYWENFKRAMRAYFRGDTSKILRWGLDLSGGKSVRIALVDHAGKQVTNPEDLNQAVNELYKRINKMGVSDRTLRVENATISIDFPGAQGLSASELVKASAMYFHIVNEQFGPFNQALAKDVNEFLQDVWNEAVVTNQKDARQINQIAYNKLQSAVNRQGRSSGVKTSAELLYDAGLRLIDLNEEVATGSFDDTLSMISMFREESKEASLKAHPLLITFANFALEGSSLENINTGFDASKGNMLTFDVRSSYTGSRAQNGGNPRDDFYAWTSQFSEEKIVGTAKEQISSGRGWRMAVILNDSVISAPSLNASLRDHAMITGGFTQREVNKLATDLKAGSLTFTPKILSEQNISPDLGKQERANGIFAAIVGVLLVVGAMCTYYRFAGLVASIAVLFNIFIIWAVMQNIEMALTLPGIAGIVLTVAMAVDANVLVFERTREEFKISKRIASALHLGYKKAFTAIVDSNLTTLIAAVILLQFDSGPVRGFAVTLVIGIIASMFTSLFMTRYFFSGWVQNPKNKELKMSEWITNPKYDFLKWTKTAFILTGIFLVAGGGILVKEWKSILGMDFTGGYSLIVDLDKVKDKENYRETASKALQAKGLSVGEFQIRELGRSNLLRIQLGISLEEAGGPFHAMPQELADAEVTYSFQKNPRILWLVDTLKSGGLSVKKSEFDTLADGWTHMSGQFSDAMRNNALIALMLSLAAVLVYIAIRFEWKFALASVLALLHDVLLTVAVLAMGHFMGLPLQIDLEVIGAIMTIIGYSLNDTIIVFDRVREDMRLMKKKSLPEIINHALNTTLSRTLMTSGTTLLVLIALVFFAGSSIFTFAFVMTAGVFLGTLSSLYIAAPILLFFEEKGKKHALMHSHA